MNQQLPESGKGCIIGTAAGMFFSLLLASASLQAAPSTPPEHNNFFRQDSLRVTGTVYDNAGAPLSGVSIQLKGSGTGTTSKEDGTFSIPVAARQGVLVFNYVGLAAKEEIIAGRSTINVYLKDKNASLKEIVVVGYANKTKSSVTGAISQIDNKAFESRPIVNTATALQGAIPGLTVMRGSGAPGSQGYDLQIRGYSSVNGNKPLILIDGVAGDLNSINPDDIANLTVLKDAAASIYGARAADGVILVTTKRGKSGAPTVNYSGNVGRKTPSYLKKVTTTQQFAEMTHESLTNVGLPGVSDEVFKKIKDKAAPDPDKGWVTYLHDYPGFYTDNNWNDILYGNAMQQSHNISVTGGGENSAYLFSGGYLKDNGVFKYGSNHADRYNLRMNYDFKILNKINVQTRNSYVYEEVTEPTLWKDMMSNLPRTFNFIPLHNPLGQYYTYQGYVNPAQQLDEGGTRKYGSNNFSFNVKMDAEIVKGLKVTGLAGININNYNDKAITRTFDLYNYEGGLQGQRNPLNSAYYLSQKDIYHTYSGFIEYGRTIANVHQLSLMAGTSLEKFQKENIEVTGSNFVGNEIFTLNLADKTKADYMGIGGGNTDWALASYFSRFTYAYDNKLFLDATIRVDGSSKFSPDKRWSAAFPAVMAAYTITQEKFMERLKWLSHLKLRASWGQSGNQEIGAFSNYGYIPLISVGGSYPLGSPNTKTPGAVSEIASTTRTWETLETTNLGIDFGFLDNRLTGSLDIYEKKNKNMLVNVQVPATLGGSAPTQNLGVLSTKGFEFTLGWKDQIGKFRYSVTAMLSDINNKLIELKGNDVLSMGLNYTHKGYPINSYFGYEANGIIQNAEQLAAYKQLGNVPSNIGVGDMMFKDIDGDGKLTPYGDPTKGSKGDLKYLGTVLPRYTYSSNISLAYGAFDLNVLIQGVGKQVNMRTGSFATPMSAIYFQPLDYFYGKSWTPENTGAQYPRLIPGAVGFDNIYNYNWQSSSMRINNLAYLRFKVITVGYNLPGELCKKLRLSSARVYLSGQDLFTISKGTWNNSFDPEEGWQRQDEQTYPFTKVTSIGVNIKF
ncbi:TonB-dependent receptor [Pseudoflavitalea sp. G-6-1-2]|uniref:SusC/RagA family TonB-linked outer membrane protein n=1 Tax=Pseudoflavitalea sp. G-6-1-2 TaxID=2728841 RepID=UPI00146D7EC6|nr:TonB-dependent receptor [Pseudoflavitalea sp. G-6-1-2]NML21308.1 TonB-dependent receptor [Pseudoflavitalea sp. G-6-1-2]